MQLPFLLSLTALAATTLAFPRPQADSLHLRQDAVDAGGQEPLGAPENRHVTCTGKNTDRPHTSQCVDALLRLPWKAGEQPFGPNTHTVPMRVEQERCKIYIETVDGVRDQASWLYTQSMAILLMNQCTYKFGAQSRTGGEVRFGQDGNIVLSITKLPRPANGLPGNGTEVYDDDDPEVPNKIQPTSVATSKH